MKTRLTDRFIRARKPPAKGRLITTDTAVPGLSLRINPASPGREQRSTVLGPYPALNLAYARQRAGDIVNAAKAAEADHLWRARGQSCH